MGLLAAPGLASASPERQSPQCRAAPTESNSSLSVRRAAGGAVATVSVSHELSGILRLDVSPGRSYSLRVDHGSGSVYFTTKPGRVYKLAAVLGPSTDRCAIVGADPATYRRSLAGTAAGESGVSKLSLASSGIGGHRDAGSSSQSRPDDTTVALGLLGGGLVCAAVTSMVLNRRRNRAAA